VVFEEYDFGEYLYERDHWIVFLAPNQSNLGTCVVALKRNEKFLGNLRKDEWEEMLRIISEIEDAVKKEFGATMFTGGSCSTHSTGRTPHHPTSTGTSYPGTGRRSQSTVKPSMTPSLVT